MSKDRPKADLPGLRVTKGDKLVAGRMMLIGLVFFLLLCFWGSTPIVWGFLAVNAFVEIGLQIRYLAMATREGHTTYIGNITNYQGPRESGLL